MPTPSRRGPWALDGPMDLIDNLEIEQGKDRLPAVNVGDTVEVHYLIREGDKERIQLFIGTVISIKRPRHPASTLTVRRIVQGEGVERTFPLHGPRVKDIQSSRRRGNVRRAKLYYLRERVGKKHPRGARSLGEKVRREREQEAAEAPSDRGRSKPLKQRARSPNADPDADEERAKSTSEDSQRIPDERGLRSSTHDPGLPARTPVGLSPAERDVLGSAGHRP